LSSNSRLSARAFWGLLSWALPLAIVFVVSPKLLHLLGRGPFSGSDDCTHHPVDRSSTGSWHCFGRCAPNGFPASASGKIDAGGTLFTLFIALTGVGAVLGGLIWLNSAAIATGIGFENAMS
jgi:hypothetical protein